MHPLLIALILSLLHFSSPTHLYHYRRDICTGLGDRVGDLMGLAALARMEYTGVVFEWCTDPSKIYVRIREHIPNFHGYDYDLTEFRLRFLVPTEIILVENVTKKHKSLEPVEFVGLPLPSEHGLNALYTTAWRTTRLGLLHITASQFKNMYRRVTKPFVDAIRLSMEDKGPYVVLHMRGPDENSYKPSPDCYDSPDMYCTARVLKRVLRLRVRVLAISNNEEWARGLLHRLPVELISNHSVYDDFSLLVGATGIIQHAFLGWSSFSSVPAMMSQSPLITTYLTTQPSHRYQVFRHYDGMPDEFHDCTQIKEFVASVESEILDNFE